MMRFLKRTRCLGALCLAWVLVLTLPASAADFDGLSDPKPLKIRGDSVEYFFEENRAEGKGNVQIDYEGCSLTADFVKANLQTKEAWAEGNVVVTREGEKHQGDSVYVNFETGVVEVEGMRAAMVPYYRVSSEEVKRRADETVEFRKASLTTCDEDQVCADGRPYYSLDADEVEYREGDKLTLKNAVLRIGALPVLFLPIVVIPIKHIQRFPVQVELGRNSEWGAFILSKLRYYINDDHDGNFLVDYRENQGIAGGAEHFYRNDLLGQGALRGYFADDQCGEDSEDCSRSGSYAPPEESRYRVQARHIGEPIPGIGVNFELNKMSDEYVIQDFFFREEFERIAFPDNYFYAVNAREDYTLSALARYRLDDFLGVVERLPEVNFDLHTRPVGDTPFYVSHKTQGASLNRTMPGLGRHRSHEAAGRVDTQSRLSYVWKTGPWTVTPYAGTRQTYYSRDKAGDSRDFVRSNIEAGVDASTKYFKVYDFSYDALGITFERLRHVFTPNVSYSFQSKPTVTREMLYEFDDRDTLDRESRVTLDFENKLQIKFRPEDDPDGELSQRPLLRSIVAVDLDIPQGNRSKFESIRTETDFNPTPWLRISTDTDYFFETDEFETVNVDVTADRHPLKIGFGQRYQSSQSNQSTIQVEWQMHPEWKAGVYERYDFERDDQSDGGKNNEFEFVLEKSNFYCWTIRFMYNRSHRENSFFVSFTPSAFQDSSFRRQRQYYHGKY